MTPAQLTTLAEECGFSVDPTPADSFICGHEDHLEAFYKAAFNAGLEAAVGVCSAELFNSTLRRNLLKCITNRRFA